ncbi:MAG: polyvinylalcohol dehydrogenase, partial [Planctomycetes bacterium]|nr:polyvinylalcohol dehydrogenase [Planctomycetota bacterium]
MLNLRKPLLPLFTLILVGFPWAAEGDSPSWPRFHGPNGDNHSTETGLLKKWPPEGPKLLWTVEKLGFGYSSVTIAHDTIYT